MTARLGVQHDGRLSFCRARNPKLTHHNTNKRTFMKTSLWGHHCTHMNAPKSEVVSRAKHCNQHKASNNYDYITISELAQRGSTFAVLLSAFVGHPRIPKRQSLTFSLVSKNSWLRFQVSCSTVQDQFKFSCRQIFDRDFASILSSYCLCCV